VLKEGNRFQVPMKVRWQFKLETTQVLCVNVRTEGSFAREQEFFGRIRSDGRITIPKVTLRLLQESVGREHSLRGTVLEVKLKPA
jgi:bifunctional DNA-binding transcriptional regulator/antitoxin component of YhaV-PrlF toxin-antitoxin module